MNPALRVACIAGVSWILPLAAYAQSTGQIFAGEQFGLDGTSAVQIALADLNVDGRRDVVAIDDAGLVQVRLGDGTGGFVARAPYVLPGALPGSRDAKVFDFDYDGVPDVLVANRGFPTLGHMGWIDVLPGDGTGGFQSALNVYGGQHFTCLDVGDWDGDGVLDIVTGSSTALTGLKGLGNGGVTPIWSSTAPGVRDVKLADLDNDGTLDLLAATSSGCVLHCMGLGAAGFGPPATTCGSPGLFNGYSSIDFGDFDGNGTIDVAAAGDDSPAVVDVFPGLGNGNFGAFTGYPLPGQYATRLVARDWTGDSRRDLAVTMRSLSGTVGMVAIFVNNGAGLFAPMAPILAGTRPNGLLAADFDGDGLRDLAVLNGPEFSFAVHKGLGGGEFDQPRFLSASSRPAAVVSGDWSGDSITDLALALSNGRLGIAQGLGGGTFTNVVETPVGTGASPSISAGDVNGDGWRDVVVSGATNTFVAMNTGGGIGAPVGLGFGLAAHLLLDLNHDGKLDLAGVQQGSFVVSLGNGLGGFSSPAAHTPTQSAQILASADINRDGHPDVVTSPMGGGFAVLTPFLGDGAGGFVSLADVALPSGHRRVALGDLDGDGAIDLLSVTTSQVFVLAGDGSGGFSAPTLIGPGADSVAIADMDGDGRSDVVVGEGLTTGASHVYVHFAGASGFTTRLYSVGDRPGAALVADLDGNDRRDIIAAEQSGAVLLANRGGFTTLVYCTAKRTSLGCLPRIGFSGAPSAAQANGFVVYATDVLSAKPGLLLHGVSGRAALPFQSGLLCVSPTVRRTPGVQSGGNLPVDCSGRFSLDMNAFAAGGLGGNPLPALRVPGTVVDCQWWGRDNGFPFPNNTQLSDALEYVVGA